MRSHFDRLRVAVPSTLMQSLAARNYSEAAFFELEIDMKSRIILCAVIVSLSSLSGVASAKGCLKGAAVGGIGGHFAGHHGLLGAAAGCAVGHHMANKRGANTAAQQTSQQPTASPSGQPAPAAPTKQ
jgi:hypothetical protein